ncbi:hypothetical protein JQ594_15555 [Bradyrhizobium manausense]|uniref:hypothetical protein n=1 Tax=Bradyrhizobium manausense TaxID=989370 RepID=UPI001BAA37F9|nr:hypothetical protein [Bradyrhizobium manausense]MBR0687347.1 hypothetical protein [Bradyrhizobium manausense]
MDRREAILAQLLAIATAAPGVRTAARNRDAPSDEESPAIIIYDGDEQVLESSDVPGNIQKPATKPRIIPMSPTIEVMLGGKPEEVGTKINDLRVYLLKTIIQDETLASLVVSDVASPPMARGIHYLGCSMGSNLGRSLQANLVLNFAFTYVLNILEL